MQYQPWSTDIYAKSLSGVILIGQFFPKAMNGVFTTDEAIDYGLLEVRHLGDIYEGLLGAILEVTDKTRLEPRNANGEKIWQAVEIGKGVNDGEIDGLINEDRLT